MTFKNTILPKRKVKINKRMLLLKSRKKRPQILNNSFRLMTQKIMKMRTQRMIPITNQTKNKNNQKKKLLQMIAKMRKMKKSKKKMIMTKKMKLRLDLMMKKVKKMMKFKSLLPFRTLPLKKESSQKNSMRKNLQKLKKEKQCKL